MSSNAWSPELKLWVQESLAKATPSNKAAVNTELKQILFKAHQDGSITTTDWSKVELQSLKAQALRTTHVPVPIPPRHTAPVIIPPPSIVSNYPALNLSARLPPPLALSENGSSASGSQPKKKKRKKNSDAHEFSFPSPYQFPSAADAQALAKRAARFQQAPASSSSGPHATGGLNHWFGDEEEDGAETISFGSHQVQVGRKKMKGKGGLGYAATEVMEVDPNVMDWDRYTIKGTNTRLEKSYLRLTSEPSPADIRPLHVLKQTLQLLKRKWKENHNYAYAVDQFKSMRQDLTVQRIKNDFTVEVYEIHARIALEANDLGEYNQCQTMLRQLYELGLPGHPQEFLSYRIIYLLHTRNRSDMASLLAQLTPEEKSDPGVHHALQVHAALTTSNYIRFFQLFNRAPNMSGYIMDHFVERERMTALGIMSKAYLTLPLPHLTARLSFESDQETDKFLVDHGVGIYANVSQPVSQPVNPWRPIKPPPPTPLEDRQWDCKKVQSACIAAMSRYRVVDLKGQVD
ncbi:SAC3/GANP/Nin1/mts3/eIF-3 p25 family-domain-containing protein [Kockovaella imperatae]|uniref:SAC3/GANP/Nin1/mts3/eIF-3 p25 family-domain-containing protein n=1 Tax=Kockovaella imperatae TaxID=4999 RepID=A0A1Y1UIT1_9TREE|nr:SAC3/GANP/Nin1/mts3/eIF-3 p25 family-domain-containing protein [Kockovaella imperatae]ORX37015.1 SAC3/GANP/Nin1/mts3/eIF-3 p25 family-domain-containing protein [Kockovaella imperatae]